MQRVLEQRLDAAHERWLRQQRVASEDEVGGGEAAASQRFWQAARAAGVNLCEASD